MPSTPTSPRPAYAAEVIMTHTIYKDYDPTTGKKIINKFLIIKEIGRGVHGKVKLAENMETGEHIAIKIVDKRSRRRQLVYSLLRGNSQQQVDNENKKSDLYQYRESEQKIQREISILKKCAHPNVVKLREVIDDPASRKIYMALEYIEGGEIEWRDDNDRPVLSIEESRRIFRDIVSGLDYIHYQGIIHRDIKPANILLSEDHVAKISDFGVSYFNELLAGDMEASDESISRMDRDLAETAGTPAFFAPELCCAGDPSLNTSDEDTEERPGKARPRISKAIDVWALGVTLYCFIFGRTPFTAATEFELFDIIPTKPVTFPSYDEIGFDVSDELKDLLLRLLEKNPDERITLDEVKRHPWVTEDLDDPESWRQQADPRRYKPVEITDEDTTIMVRLRKSFQKLSSSLSSLTHGITRRRTKSIAQPTQPQPANTALTSRRISNPPIQGNDFHDPPKPSRPSYSTSILPYPKSSTAEAAPAQAVYVHPSGSMSPRVLPHAKQQLLRPISCLSDDSRNSIQDVIEEPEEEYSQERPGLNRQHSSASSSSGLNITFGRGRTGLTPLTPTK
ncbi:hypothetical protein EC973_005904 [Apophysomyces ossiformis]|uniref:Protein kinase domain-containing protein n=1 Tax=Apophysomyces ossiformis TaxID=679940 RepID=A0A8H7BK06_9FUNG|nr:hypothetical protein EC973_005904 [Apophysomyces ossiformis]